MSWAITLATLLVFAAASVSEQKGYLLEGLRSKALSISSSLIPTMKRAAVTGDYSSLVEKCAPLLATDHEIEYLVLTKADGSSFIITRGGWRTGRLDRFWRPQSGLPSGEIVQAPLVDRRAFDFSAPFDRSAVPGGRINVGLDLDAYNRSLSWIYAQTSALAVLCIGVSFLVSVVCARLLVEPILRLQSVVRKLAKGDLKAPTVHRGGDEIEFLADSFTTMAESLLQRDRILESVRFAARQFMSPAAWQTVTQGVLAKVGLAGQATRVFVFENHPGEEQDLLGTVRYQWTAPVSAPLNDRVHEALSWDGIRWDGAANRLRRGECVAMRRRGPDGAGPRSSILIPLEVAGAWFGFIGVEDWTREREWSAAECDSFRTVADMLGASIARRQDTEYVDNILLCMDESLIVTDPDLKIRRVNPRTLLLLGYTEDELIGQSASKVMEIEEPALATGAERYYWTRSGGFIPVLFSSAELRNGMGLLEGYVWLAQDMTELTRVQEEIARARDAAEQSNRAKSTFLANMSHELRTPLNAIIGYSQMLAEDCGLAPSREFEADLRKIERSGYLLLSIIDDILDLSKVEAGRMELHMEIFDVADVLRDVQSTVHPLAIQRGNILEIACDEEAREGYGDVAKFRQSLLNLANNACKFTENGTVEIAVHKVRRGSRALLEVQVSDSGIGIAPEHLSKLFQPFSQVDGSAARKYGGTGLGLAISRKFCQMMGGDITVESERGCGSRFSILIPAPDESVQEAFTHASNTTDRR
jgi:PAS domain S-box-containing protein